MNYEDFILEISPDRGDRFVVRVQDSPAGRGEGLLKLPWAICELGSLLEDLGHEVRTAPRNDSSGNREKRDLMALEASHQILPTSHEIGEKLFQALFSGPVRDLYERSRGTIERHSGSGLRLQLKLNPKRPELAPILSLPWELLRQPEIEGFLSLNRSSPVVRSLDVPRPPRPVSFPPSFRILVLLACPEGLEPLDLPQERASIEKAFRYVPRVQTVCLERATPWALRKALLDGPFHAIHFMGHGSFDPSTGEGVLLFEGAQRELVAVSAEDFSNQLKDFKSVRLVLLNACDTARARAEDGLSPFAGAANALILGGIPAVVAMQFPISDLAAIAFSRVFYQRLAAGDQIDAAVAEGRQEIASANPGALEWATPVLFLNARSTGKNVIHPAGLATHLVAIFIFLLASVAGTALYLRTDRTARLAALNELSQQLLEEGRLDEARQELEAALKVDPASAETWSNLGELEGRAGRTAEAQDGFRKAAELAPKSELHQYNYASFLISREDYEGAAQRLEKALEIAPENAEVLNDLGWVYLRLRRPETARTPLERGLSTSIAAPNTRAALHKNLGWARLETGDPRAAVESLDAALRILEPQQSKLRLEAHLLLARAFAALGQQIAACEELRLFAAGSGLLYSWRPDPKDLAQDLDCQLGRQLGSAGP